MKPSPSDHWSFDDYDDYESGQLSPTARFHFETCERCRSAATADLDLRKALTTLETWTPAASFESRVMARVALQPASSTEPATRTGQRFVVSRRTLAWAASIAIVVVGSATASVLWSLQHQALVTGWAKLLMSESSRLVWLGLQTATANITEQPWYAGLRTVWGTSTRLALVLAASMVAYTGGVVMMRRLLAAPAPTSANAH